MKRVFSLDKGIYSRSSLEIAAQVYGSKAAVYLSENRSSYEVTLEPAKPLDAGQLRALENDFVNELLNQEYRAVVSRFNGKLTQLYVTQALYCARGGENLSKAPKPSAEFLARADALMRDAQNETERTMPKKIDPPGPLFPVENA